jgi:quinol monooxygenase YgiN
MVRLSITLKSNAGGEQALVDALRFLRAGILLEPGCVRCCVWVEPDSTVQFVEEWATEADLKRHVRSDRFTSLLAVLESAPERPQIQFDFVASSRGLEYVAEVRHELVK